MRNVRLALVFVSLVLCAAAGGPANVSSRDALRPFNELVGTWRGTGTPAGSRREQAEGFWQETITCEWKFKGPEARIVLDFEKSKHYRHAEIEAVAGQKAYRMHLQMADGKALVLKGPLQGNNVTLDSDPPGQRVVLTLLHDNRFLYRHETLPEGKNLFVRAFQVGATKEGVPFASGSGQPECIVTGGFAKTPVMYQGKTYYVCCSGCRDEFLADPERYIREAAEAKAKGK